MYYTSMSRSDELERLDVALLALRRFAQAPSATGRAATVGHGRDQVEISTVLVVDAVARFDPGGDCSVGDVAGALQVVHSTASRLVERAVRTGMVHRGRSRSDPRRTVLSLTAAGQRLQRDAVDFRTGRLDALLAEWAADDVTTFTDLMERFARCAHRSTEKMP
jgi:DNA-binding MarR family transcriptional regulator